MLVGVALLFFDVVALCGKVILLVRHVCGQLSFHHVRSQGIVTDFARGVKSNNSTNNKVESSQFT